MRGGWGSNLGPKDFQGKDNGNLWSYIIIIGWYIIESQISDTWVDLLSEVEIFMHLGTDYGHPERFFFYENPNLFWLWQTNWGKKFGGIFGQTTAPILAL